MATQAEIAVLRGTATQVKNESRVGGNTAGRVGGLFEGIVDALPSDEVIDGKITQAVADIQPIEITGDVTNAPDEEDLTSENQGGTDVLKFKDKAYNAALYSGLGRVYLRKNIVTLEGTGKNVLTQAMVNTANTIYHIQYDYDLNGQTITVPAGCVLEFDGGSVKNGTLILANTTIKGTSGFAQDLNVSGTLANDKVYFDWFEHEVGQSCTAAMQKALDLSISSGKTLFIGDGEYLLTISNASASGTKHCLYTTGSVNIEGESRDGTILKTVKTDLSSPDFDTPETDSYGYRYSTSYGTFLRVIGSADVEVNIRNITIDGGNEQKQTTNQNVGHKALWLSAASPYSVTAIHISNTIVKNFEGEGIYNTGYALLDNKSDYVIDGCQFANNGGSSGNVGGSVTYRGCLFDNANIEHTFGSGNHYGTFVADGCIFKNRNTMLSCDKQGTATSYNDVIGCVCKITGCTFDNSDTTPQSTDRYLGVSLKECEQIIITNNTFHNVGYRASAGGAAISIGNYVSHLYVVGNVLLTDNASFNNDTITASTPKSHFYKNNISTQLNGSKSTNIQMCDRLRVDAPQTTNSVVYAASLGGKVWTINVAVQNGNASQVSLSYFNITGFYTGGSVAVPANTIQSVRNVTGNFGTITIQAPFASVTADEALHVIIDGWLEEFADVEKTSTARPKLSANDVGYPYYDASLGKTIYWNGTEWIDGTGVPAGSSLKVLAITQADYDALTTKDTGTLYVITQ